MKIVEDNDVIRVLPFINRNGNTRGNERNDQARHGEEDDGHDHNDRTTTTTTTTTMTTTTTCDSGVGRCRDKVDDNVLPSAFADGNTRAGQEMTIMITTMTETRTSTTTTMTTIIISSD